MAEPILKVIYCYTTILLKILIKKLYKNKWWVRVIETKILILVVRTCKGLTSIPGCGGWGIGVVFGMT